jgi:hypothetical protein
MSHYDIITHTPECTGEEKTFKSQRTINMWHKLHIKKCDKCPKILTHIPPLNFVYRANTSTDVTRLNAEYQNYINLHRAIVE